MAITEQSSRDTAVVAVLIREWRLRHTVVERVEALRFADEDQHLLDLLDYQGCGAAPQARRIDYQHVQRAAFEPSANVFDYAITKAAAIANFTKGLSEPLMEKHGIRATRSRPGRFGHRSRKPMEMRRSSSRSAKRRLTRVRANRLSWRLYTCCSRRRRAAIRRTKSMALLAAWGSPRICSEGQRRMVDWVRRVVSTLLSGGQRRDRTADAGLFRAALYH